MQSAWNDQLELAEVGAHIERQSVHRNPAREPHAERAHFRAADPDARCARLARAGQAERRERVDHRALEQSEVAVHAQTDEIEIEHEVRDDLPRSMPGDIATAVGFDALHTERGEAFIGDEDVRRRIGAARHGDDRRHMLDEEDGAERERRLNCSRIALREIALREQARVLCALQFVRSRVRDSPEILHADERRTAVAVVVRSNCAHDTRDRTRPHYTFALPMPTIHPTAIIEGDVTLADDVTVGPFCHLRGVLGPLRVGAGTRLRSFVMLEGPLDLGARNDLHPQVCLGGAPQDLGFPADTPGAGLIIGDDNVFREGATIHRPKTALPGRIGNSNYWMANSHAGHDCIVGNHCIFANGALLGGHVEVADRVNLGGNATVHQFVRVGRCAMIGGLSGIGQDLCPFFMVTAVNVASTVNVVGLRRQGGTPEQIDTVRWVHQTICRSGLLLKSAIEVLRSRAGNPLVDEYLAFIAASKRGIVMTRGRSSARSD